MPEHVLTPEVEIITDGGRRRRWTAAEKLRMVEAKPRAGWAHQHLGHCPSQRGGGQSALPLAPPDAGGRERRRDRR